MVRESLFHTSVLFFLCVMFATLVFVMVGEKQGITEMSLTDYGILILMGFFFSALILLNIYAESRGARASALLFTLALFDLLLAGHGVPTYLVILFFFLTLGTLVLGLFD